MMDREKVIKGLECCTTQGFGCIENKKCPYGAQRYGSHCVDSMLRDALALLKAQEPRVMTCEEAQANVQDGPFIIFEVRDSTGSEVDFGVLVGDFYEMSEGSVLTVRDFWMHKDEYGKQFRLWTSVPTDEQRKVTPWK